MPRFLCPLGVSVTVVQTDRETDTTVVLSGHCPPSQGTLCQRCLREDVVARVGHSIFVLCPPYSSPACVEWSTTRLLIELHTLPPSHV